jgi:maltose-binding protein MalE
MKKTTVRSLSFFLCFAVLLSLLALNGSPRHSALAQTEAATVAPTATVKPMGSTEGTITIWSDRARVPALTKIGTEFTAKYNVPVRIQELDFGAIRDNLKIAGPAGEGPDIIVGGHDWVGELASNGLLSEIDLGDKLKSFDPVGVQAFSFGGKLYGMPYALEAVALYYNKDLVPNPPKTWDELKSIAKKLQDDKKVEQGYVLQENDPYHFYPIMSGFGGYIFGKDASGALNPKDVGLDTPGGLKGIEELDAMIKSGLLRANVSYQTMMDLFTAGKSAMMITGPWALADIRKAKVNYGVATIPKMANTPRPFVGSQGFMVNKFSKNELLAKTFLTEYIATDEAMQAIFDVDPRASAWLPVREKVKDADLVIFGESAANGDPMPNIPEMNAVWDAWGKAITLVFQQKENPDKAFKDAAQAIREKIAAPK